jgi:hypothetical protein
MAPEMSSPNTSISAATKFASDVLASDMLATVFAFSKLAFTRARRAVSFFALESDATWIALACSKGM